MEKRNKKTSGGGDGKSSPNWSDLPPKPLQIISSKLTLLIDYISFRSTCTSWRSAAKPSDLPPQLPIFMLPYDPGLDDEIRELFCLPTNKLYQLDLPEACEARCFGSNHGWFLVLGTTPAVSLLNPLTRAQIPLPPLTTLPGVFGFDPKRPGEEYGVYDPLVRQHRRKSPEAMRDWFVCRAVVSSNPVTSDDCVVMVVLYDSWKLAFCRPGDKAWTEIDAGMRSGFGALTYHDGKFYAIDGAGRVAVCDVHSDPPRATIIPSLKWHFDDQCYLVDSAVGLLLIIRYRHGGDEGSGGKEFFDVFKMDKGGKKPRWERTNRIDGDALFLCDNHGLSIRASEFPGCKPNCIYYTDPFYNIDEYNLGGHDVGVFSMEDASINFIHFYDDDSLEWRKAMWLRPSLC